MAVTRSDRQEQTFPLTVTDADTVNFWHQKALIWATQSYEHVAFFNNNADQLYGFSLPYRAFPNRLVAGVRQVVEFGAETDPFHTLYQVHQREPDFRVGYLSYDLKNRIESLSSRNPDRMGFPDLYFFQPLHVIDFENTALTIRSFENPGKVFESIEATAPNTGPVVRIGPKPTIERRVSPEEYRQTVKRIQQDIIDGTVYELNYCIEFFAKQADLDPLAAYWALNDRSPMPFSHFLRIGNRYSLGASPERFLKKEGNRLVSQPIKGTIRRGQTIEEDRQLQQHLQTSEKERAENLMIVDLVRNDLARSAETGTVQVDELFGIYPFQQLSQMVSTVSASLRDSLPFTEALRHAFPMGSMTGAPKVRAMELIDQYEATRRGPFSGAAGFITPEGDFDFNVMIRSIFYNQSTRYLSFSVGSAITYDADPQQEYEECLLKADAILAIL
ncbi:anthranilate synthase component I family protein [Larkinella sp. VNQ87]|uniref:anthranilate synthase component I family protein n=1 Tax=Larkinella sp. VNQ87 TaxID=3400921 RepID=UPI003C0F71C6